MERTLSLVLLLALLGGNALASQKLDLFSKIEQDFREKEASWHIERIYDESTREPFSKSIVFRSRKLQASIQVKMWNRLEDAREEFALSTADITRARSKSVRKPVANLGEESYMWTNPGSTAWPIINFR